MFSLNDICLIFLNFFECNGYCVVEFSLLVLCNDFMLMFMNLGMVQFKNLFIGVEMCDYNCVIMLQKCVCVGGKYNDLDNVGYIVCYYMFFEMLGNFSFGDYFKFDVIFFVWELLIKDFGIFKDKLLVIVYYIDDEVVNIWKKVVGLIDDCIICIFIDDNFWCMGLIGFCGFCIEIFFDYGDYIWGGLFGLFDEDGDRFIEIWNFVFMQNEQFEDGLMCVLDMQLIDIGMGLECIGVFLQGKYDNYDIDLMCSLIEVSVYVISNDFDGFGKVYYWVIVDYLCLISFLIVDGVMFLNEGCGYVLCWIMCCVMCYVYILGVKDLVMYKLVLVLVCQMGMVYFEFGCVQVLIEEILKFEEICFKQMLDRGLCLLDDELVWLFEGVDLLGEVVFKLYDIYGFLFDLMQDVLCEKGCVVEMVGFDMVMVEQKVKVCVVWVGLGEIKDVVIWLDLVEQYGVIEFLGYDIEIVEGQILVLVQDGVFVKQVGEGSQIQIVVNQMFFYGEFGGQVGDIGLIKIEIGVVCVIDMKKIGGVFIYVVEVMLGMLLVGQGVQFLVDYD